MTQYGFYFDNSRCTGCRTCVAACNDYKQLSLGEGYRRVIDYEGGNWEVAENGVATQDCYVYHVSVSCNHCDNPACAAVCPTGAMHKDENGLVLVDHSKCVGCGYCTMACPYHAPFIKKDERKSCKCDGCKSRVLQGLAPICVGSCPLRALQFDTIENLKEKYPDSMDSIIPLADGSYTQPNLYIAPSAAAQQVLSNPELQGEIGNLEEI